MKVISWETKFEWNFLMEVVAPRSMPVNQEHVSNVVSKVTGLGEALVSARIIGPDVIFQRECPTAPP
jgi:hypothetical protein